MNKEEAKKQIDADDAAINGVKLITTCRAKEIIDAIEYHQKVKLPREVGEELNEWVFDNKDRLVGRIGELIFDMMTHEPKLTNVLCFAGDSEENYFKIIDAYRYGWEAEPEAKWYVKALESWGLKGCYFCKHSNGQVFPEIPNPAAFDSYWTQFTRAELKKYHFDSDIFTLVPVEDEK